NRTPVGRISVNGPPASLRRMASPVRRVASRLPCVAMLLPARFTPRNRSSLASRARGSPPCRTPPSVPVRTDAPGRNHFVSHACTGWPRSGSIGSRPRSRSSRMARSRARAGSSAVENPHGRVRRGHQRHAVTPCVRTGVGPHHATRCSLPSTIVFRRVQDARPAREARYPRAQKVRTGLSRRVLASSLWPLGLALQVSVVGVAGWSHPDSVGRAMGLTTVVFLLVLLGLEQVLPYRQGWSIRRGRET